MLLHSHPSWTSKCTQREIQMEERKHDWPQDGNSGEMSDVRGATENDWLTVPRRIYAAKQCQEQKPRIRLHLGVAPELVLRLNRPDRADKQRHCPSTEFIRCARAL